MKVERRRSRSVTFEVWPVREEGDMRIRATVGEGEVRDRVGQIAIRLDVLPLDGKLFIDIEALVDRLAARDGSKEGA